MTLFSAIFQSVFKRRDVSILLAFSFLPLLVPTLAGLGETVQVDQEATSSLLGFLISVIEVQYQFILPGIMLGLITASVLRDEIDSRILFLYKDIKRSKIFNAKLLSLFAVYGLFFLATLLVTVVTYFIYRVPQTGFRLLPQEGAATSLHYLLVLIGLNLTLITVLATCSIKKKTMVAVMLGIFFNLFSNTAPMWVGIRYLFPNSYATTLAQQFPLGSAIGLSLILTAIYLGLAYGSARRNFDMIEF
ncbi:ABC transporter permease [Streptococcus ovuberis]|uniref:ABC transporter permease subunit n=1 Tax=Streptococcus ovuberis TaxID=1936207 RepID=A0A7X6MVR8_9STRE|nr:ABC transporter permease [Streptococcus ovuberis]NKZ19320.1 ABC transporter permease subunit [Streptococcus ovuberis]